MSRKAVRNTIQHVKGHNFTRIFHEIHHIDAKFQYYKTTDGNQFKLHSENGQNVTLLSHSNKKYKSPTKAFLYFRLIIERIESKNNGRKLIPIMLSYI